MNRRRGQHRRPRVSLQEERTEETRERLRRATLESLVEVGSIGTTVSEIADRAGMSRGALLHHYKAKTALIVDSIMVVLERRHDEMRQRLERDPPNQDQTPAEAVDLLWSMFEGWSFPAYIEVVVASRTDPELHDAFVPQIATWVYSVGETLGRYMPAVTSHSLTRDIQFLFAVLDGIALSSHVYPEARDATDRLLAILKRLVS